MRTGGPREYERRWNAIGACSAGERSPWTAAIKSFMTSACRLRTYRAYHGSGIVACMQPRHCAPDITGQCGRRPSGADVPKYAWPFRSLRRFPGAILAFRRRLGRGGTMDRHSLASTQHSPEKAWTGSQKVAGFEIRRSTWRLRFRGYTINGAYAKLR